MPTTRDGRDGGEVTRGAGGAGNAQKNCPRGSAGRGWRPSRGGSRGGQKFAAPHTSEWNITYPLAACWLDQMKVFLKVTALYTQRWAKKSLMIFFAQNVLRDDFLCSFQWNITYPLAACWLDQMKVFLKVSALYTQRWAKKSLMIFFAQNVLWDDFLCSFQWKRTYPLAACLLDQMKVFLKVTALYNQRWAKKSLMIFFAQNVLRDDFLCSKCAQRWFFVLLSIKKNLPTRGMFVRPNESFSQS